MENTPHKKRMGRIKMFTVCAMVTPFNKQAGLILMIGVFYVPVKKTPMRF